MLLLRTLGVLFLCFFTGPDQSYIKSLPSYRPSPPVPLRPQNTQIQIAVVGDLMCHSSQYNFARQADGSYNFNSAYEFVKPILSGADLALGNLETTLSGPGTTYSGYPGFCSPNAYADALVDAGFDWLSTTNNHSYDKFEKGIRLTIKELQARNIPFHGTFETAAQRDSIKIWDIKGIKIAILAYTQFSNIPLPAEKRYLMNFIDLPQVELDIKKARKKGAELVIVHYHWGDEYKREPNPYQRDITQKTIKLGADFIFAGHPHVIEPVEKYKSYGNTNLDSGLVAYSLGNFFSAQNWRHTDAGVIIKLNITKNAQNNKFSFTTEYVPTWVFSDRVQDKRYFKIFPAEWAYHGWLDSLSMTADYAKKIPLKLSAVHKNKMKQAADDTKYVMELYRARPQFAKVAKPQ